MVAAACEPQIAKLTFREEQIVEQIANRTQQSREEQMEQATHKCRLSTSPFTEDARAAKSSRIRRLLTARMNDGEIERFCSIQASQWAMKSLAAHSSANS
jgi:hypothetical protein